MEEIRAQSMAEYLRGAGPLSATWALKHMLSGLYRFAIARVTSVPRPLAATDAGRRELCPVHDAHWGGMILPTRRHVVCFGASVAPIASTTLPTRRNRHACTIYSTRQRFVAFWHVTAPKRMFSTFCHSSRPTWAC